ncbi:helix-turn-helix domain-containing transcriptional regulator [Pseudogemmobacter bohemicus]|uniref:helix-turn-helix domain-containing transcriptional regulator n=1 Tax=Pseudogemmobacter bohemicus TaxID=2250708 RepID=UPI0038CD47D2
MAIETPLFDASRCLGTPEARVVFLRDALETGDAGYSHALGVIARARGMSHIARDAGLSR